MSHGHGASADPQLHGIMAEFEDEDGIISATQQAVDAGYKKMETYTPYPLEELMDILHLHKNKVALVILIGGIVGCCVGFYMQYYASVIHYPINVGGRPFNSWPAFVPVMFESVQLSSNNARIVLSKFSLEPERFVNVTVKSKTHYPI